MERDLQAVLELGDALLRLSVQLDLDGERALPALAQACGPTGNSLAAAGDGDLAGADRAAQHATPDADRAMGEAHALTDHGRQLGGRDRNAHRPLRPRGRSV